MYRECFLLFVINNQRGIKIAHFFFLRWPGLFVSFLSPCRKLHHALWILNSNHYASAADRQAKKCTQEWIVISLDWYRGMWNACYGLTWVSPPLLSPHSLLLLPASRTSQQTAMNASASAEDGIFPLCFTKHHTFCFCCSRKFAKCRFRPGREFWHRRIFSQPHRSSHFAGDWNAFWDCFGGFFLLKYFFISNRRGSSSSSLRAVAHRTNKFARPFSGFWFRRH